MDRESLTLLEYALLGLLRIVPLSGYDVQRIFASTPLGHFSSSPGAIYPALKRLEKRGLVRFTVDASTELRPRRLSALAEPGMGALDAWAHEPVTRDELLRDGRAPVLRFSLMEGFLSTSDVIGYLRGYGDVVRAYLDELREQRPLAEGAGGLHPLLSLEHGIRGYEAQAAWTDWAIEQLQEREDGLP
jgi:DNA-binding PadR family transcriptional regulator